MRAITHIVASLAAVLMSCSIASAQINIGNSIEIDKVTHNFGDVLLNSGPVSCEFTLTNNGDAPFVIYSVTTTCGCTDAEWTRQPIKKGEKGKISITYSNDEGPYPFDKNATVYLSTSNKPLILKLRGISREEMRPIEEMYPTHIGALGIREEQIKCGNLEQGKSKTENVIIANISPSPLKIDFKDVDENLDIAVSPNPIPAKSTATMTVTVKADREKWGKNYYWATLLQNGRSIKENGEEKKLGVWAFTKENFDNLSEEDLDKGPMPRFENSTFDFGKAPVGKEIHATFKFRNEGKSCFCVYKLDVDTCCYSHSDIPSVEPGAEGTFRVHIDTKDLPKGKCMKIVTLTTNSPLRPVINLFITGTLE